MTPRAIFVPYEAFREGVERMHGCCVEDQGQTLSLAFEPGFVEATDRREVPCLRLVFRKQGDQVILEKFVVCDGVQEMPIDLGGAHDALQAWMDAVSD